jgi:hypothetical protein
MQTITSLVVLYHFLLLTTRTVRIFKMSCENNDQIKIGVARAGRVQDNV